MIFAYWINRTRCARGDGSRMGIESATPYSERSMRNDSLYVPSRVNRDKLFFMFLRHIEEKKEIGASRAHNKVMKCKTRNALIKKPQDIRCVSSTPLAIRQLPFFTSFRLPLAVVQFYTLCRRSVIA